MGKRKAPGAVIEDLEKALDSVNELLDTSPISSCDISEASKKEIKTYVECYVKWRLEKVLHWANGGSFGITGNIIQEASQAGTPCDADFDE